MTPLTPEEIQRAVQGPAERVGVRFDPGLVARLVAELGNGSGALPLLQYTLTELFDARTGAVVPIEAYDELGGVSTALANRADSVYLSLDTDERDVARDVFLRLVTFGEGTADTRRRMRVSELVQLAQAGAVRQVLDAFGRHRLLTFDRDHISREPTVEIAHETLLRDWPRLRDWIEQSRDEVRQVLRLEASAHEWADHDRAAGYLLHGPRLDQARELTDGSLRLSPLATSFVEESDLAHERQRASRTRRRRTITGTFALAAVVAAVLALIAVDQRNQARGSALLATARNVVEENLDLALLLSVEAAELLGPEHSDVEETLHNLLLAGTPAKDLPLPDDALARSAAVAVRPGTDQIAATSSGNVVALYDGLTEIARFGTPNEVDSSSVPSIAFDSTGDRIAAIDTLGVLRVWDVASGDTLHRLPTGENDTGTVAFGPTDDVIVTSIHTRTAWDLTSGSPRWTNDLPVQTFGGADIAIDASGTVLAWPSIISGEVVGVGVDDGEVLWSFPLPGAIAVDFHPTEPVLLVKSQFSGVWLYDIGGDSPVLIQQISGVAPTDVSFDATGSRFVDGGTETGRVFAPRRGDGAWTQIDTFNHGAALPLSFAWLPDGSIAAGQPRHAGVWSLAPPGEVTRVTMEAPASGVEAIPGTELVMTTHDFLFGQNRLVIRDIDSGEVMVESAGEPTGVESVPVGSKGTELVAWLPGSEELVMVDPQTQTPQLTLPGHADGLAPRLVDVDSTGSRVVVAYAEADVVVIDVGRRRAVRNLSPDVGTVWALSLNDDGSRLAVGGDDGVVLYDLDTDQAPPATLPSEGNNFAATFSPDGRTLVTADDTFGLLNVYDVESRARIASIPVPGAHDPEFSGDGTRLVLAAAQSGIVAFDAATWTRLWTIDAQSLPAAVLTLDVDGDRVVFADVSGVIQQITLDAGELLAIARDRISRIPTELECETYGLDCA